MNENYYALMICIIKGCLPEQAFEILECGKPKPSIIDIRDLIDLKKTHTYKQIGLMYGLSDNAIYRRLKKHRGEK